MSHAGRIVVLTGPTGVGKTEVALALAAPLGAEIVVADARQIVRGMRVGAAQPTAAERARVPHHLVDCVDPLTHYTAADYARDGRRVLADLARRQVTPLVCGGSGLYLRALIEGLFEGPGRDPALRRRLEAEADRRGDRAMHERLVACDPETAARLHPHDRVRVVRALEVFELTGVALSEHHRRQPDRSLAERTRTIVLNRRRDDLYARIDARAAAMFDGGLLDEARALLALGLTPEHATYRTVGYAEAFAYLAGSTSRATAIGATQQASRRYAKRQLVWFRALAGAHWLDVAPDEKAAAVVERILAIIVRP